MTEESTREDLGYTKKYPIKKDTKIKEEQVRIRLHNGEVFRYAKAFADDLIKRKKGTRDD
jgi:hypothetical protein